MAFWIIFPQRRKDLSILLHQYHDCWWPGYAWSQGISIYVIDLVHWKYSSLSTRYVDIHSTDALYPLCLWTHKNMMTFCGTIVGAIRRVLVISEHPYIPMIFNSAIYPVYTKLVICCVLSWFIYLSILHAPSQLLHWHEGNHIIGQSLFPSTNETTMIWINEAYDSHNTWWYSHNKTKKNKTMFIFYGIYC